jgi:hypothetical protein
MNDLQIESLLRKAPRPTPPAGLKERLLTDFRLPYAERDHERPVRAALLPLWRRWFPALSFGLFLFGCFILLGVQTRQLLELRHENETLHAATANLEQLRQDNAELERLRLAVQETERGQKEQDELLKLRAEVTRLRAVTQEVSLLRAENQRLQGERAAAAAKTDAVREEDPLNEAKEKALRIRCINNIKQIGLAARMWAHENKTNLPLNFLAVTNELTALQVLTCPADTARTPVRSWQEYDGNSLSYELLSPGASERNPDVVYVRCPIHNNVGLADGSAQQLGTNFQVMKVDGKFKIVRLQAVVPKPAPQP